MEARGTRVSRFQRPPDYLDWSVDRLVVWQPWGMSWDDWYLLSWWVEEGGTLIVATDYPTELYSLLPDWEQDWTLEPSYPLGNSEINVAAIGPPVEGVGRLVGERATGMLTPPSGAVVYAVNSMGRPVVTGWPLGEGQVYLISDPSLLANGWILEGDNAVLAVNLLDPGPGGRLAFDEYHHGVEAAQDWWQTLRPQMRWTMLQATLAAVMLLVLSGARLGRPVEIAEGISRQNVEFAHGLANLLRESRANRWVLDRLYRSFRRDLAKRLGRTEKVGHQELGRLWQMQTGESPTELVALLDRCSAPEAPRDQALLQIIRQMAEYRRRLGGA